MSYEDFCRCTPDEFNAVCEAYGKKEEALYRDNWQRMRMLATISIQPHTKSKITPQKLLPFEWETKPKPFASKAASLSIEERRKRFKEITRILDKNK